MNRAIEEAIDNITQHTHENRYAIEGWKTNAGHMINKKFILDWMVEPSFRSGMSLKYSSNRTKVDDLMKAICYLKAIKYDAITSLEQFFDRFDDRITTNHWYDMGMFEFKCFKKGTMHLRFSDEKDWEIVNRAYAKIKGQNLPEKL